MKQNIICSIIERIGMDSFKYDVFSMKSQQLKFHAFFSYLRSFSEAGVDTLHKLETMFHKQVKKKNKQNEILTNMKSILTSYQIFILEIKDSCDFVQLPQFGFCIGKAFLQMIKIIKWFLRSWLKNSKKYEAIKFKVETQENKNTEMEEPQEICSFCQELIKNNPYGKDNRSKRKAVAIDACVEISTAKKNYEKERSHMMEFQQNILEKYTMKEISSKRYITQHNEPDFLAQKYAAMKLQFSNKDNVLEQILNEFNLKTESISRFVNHNQIISLEDYKMSSGANYDLIEAEMKIKIAEKYEQAKERLKDLVANKFHQFQQRKRNKMQDKNIQASFNEFTDKQKMEVRIKQHLATIRSLKNELESQKQLNQSLRKLLESKSVEFQEQFLNFRKSLFFSNNRECDSKTFLKSLKSIRDILDDNKTTEKSLQIKSFKKDEDSGIQSITKTQNKGSILKERRGKGKKKHSIKFSLENEQISQEDDNIRQTVFSEYDSVNEIQALFTSTATQTQQSQTSYSISAEHSPLNKKFYLISRQHSIGKETAKLKRQSRVKRSGNLQELCNKNSFNNYSHVKSKVYESVQTSRPLSSNYVKCKQSPQLNKLVKKLTANYLFQNKPTDRFEAISTPNSNINPIFCTVYSLTFSSEDVFNLYLTQKNAQNYQCLLYRNSIFSNVNPKRSVNYQKKFQSSDLEWNFKKDYEGSDSFQNKFVAIIFQQINAIKRKEKNSYDQLKLILRAPTNIDNNTEIINLENTKEHENKDIDIGELKKMVNIILRFHLKCLAGRDKQALCGHLVHFCNKIGIKFY